jgi:hypothetical protein
MPTAEHDLSDIPDTARPAARSTGKGAGWNSRATARDRCSPANPTSGKAVAQQTSAPMTKKSGAEQDPGTEVRSSSLTRAKSQAAIDVAAPALIAD